MFHSLIATTIADAFINIAKADHYMVIFDRSSVTLKEMNDARQVLIDKSNNANNEDDEIELALNMLELNIKEKEKE
jgi:hypothetical protein